jgi:hypothetical protein
MVIHVLGAEPKPACGPGKFRCDDGVCIDEDYRCDEVADCCDGSDERYCGGPTEGGGTYKSAYMLAEGCDDLASDGKIVLIQVGCKDFTFQYY